MERDIKLNEKWAKRRILDVLGAGPLVDLVLAKKKITSVIFTPKASSSMPLPPFALWINA